MVGVSRGGWSGGGQRGGVVGVSRGRVEWGRVEGSRGWSGGRQQGEGRSGGRVGGSRGRGGVGEGGRQQGEGWSGGRVE